VYVSPTRSCARSSGASYLVRVRVGVRIRVRVRVRVRVRLRLVPARAVPLDRELLDDLVERLVSDDDVEGAGQRKRGRPVLGARLRG